MADNSDIAAENQQRLNEAALARRREAAAERESTEYCIDCDAAIPERRRQSVKGTKRCVECATDYEKRWQ